MITTQAILQNWIGEPQNLKKGKKRKCDLGWTRVEKRKKAISWRK
jgi:hypothetical protein